MPEFYFFPDADLLIPQQSIQAYTATTVPTSPNEFRITKLYSVMKNPNAYAVCNVLRIFQKQKPRWLSLSKSPENNKVSREQTVSVRVLRSSVSRTCEGKYIQYINNKNNC